MPHDKQLKKIKLADVLEKRQLGQALNIKEFAVLVGVSYSTAREWFHSTGFPAFRGMVFWSAFVQWRDAQSGLRHQVTVKELGSLSTSNSSISNAVTPNLPIRAKRLLMDS